MAASPYHGVFIIAVVQDSEVYLVRHRILVTDLTHACGQDRVTRSLMDNNNEMKSERKCSLPCSKGKTSRPVL